MKRFRTEPRIIRQESIDEGVDKVILALPAPTEFQAKNRARIYMRSRGPWIKRLHNVKALGSEEIAQTGIQSRLPEALHDKLFTVGMLIVK